MLNERSIQSHHINPLIIVSRVGKGGEGWLEANIDFKHCHLSYVEVIPGILKEKKKKKKENTSFV